MPVGDSWATVTKVGGFQRFGLNKAEGILTTRLPQSGYTTAAKAVHVVPAGRPHPEAAAYYADTGPLPAASSARAR